MDTEYRSILLVDDDPEYLTALQRLLESTGHQIHCADSGEAGLNILSDTPMDLVISDMNMPNMSGDEFLSEVAANWPETERIGMTASVESEVTVRAINKGKVSRFLLKPWDDDEMLEAVEKCLRLGKLKRENEQLHELTLTNNKQLKKLTHKLAGAVEDRTARLLHSHTELKSSYRLVVRMFSALTARRLGQLAEDNVRLNELMVTVAKLSPLKGGDLKQLYYAWQLRNIGKLSFDDQLIKPAYLQLAPARQRLFQRHPLLAQAQIMLVKPLYDAGKVISQHKEYLDGSGYPNGLKGDDINLGAQYLCVVNDYVELVNGRYSERAYSTAEAIHYMHETAVERYNPEALQTLVTALQELSSKGATLKDEYVGSVELKPGMKLTRDLLSEQHVLLLSAGMVMDEVAIERLREMEFNLGEHFRIYIQQRRAG
ncbi:HD domain-containing phosphohydrolase [Aliamphritea ceti]|uniref:HD domain-containing phosphohydrolase n=1 Tax=Aliamphritea ceti TaxID=1524258 RepID=UPI0021C3996E|nr:HD domain-containing phosphohydrolase [Aliamphritea ceti]